MSTWGARTQDVVPYTERFKEEMLKRMLGPEGISATELARQAGVSQPALSRWLRDARRVELVKKRREKKKDEPVTPKRWTASEKLRLIVAAEGLQGEELSALLRSEGVYESELKEWREAASAAISPTTEGAPGPLSAAHRKELAAVQREVKELKRELRRKEKALAEAAALLILEKKLQALGWDERFQGDEDDEPDGTNEK